MADLGVRDRVDHAIAQFRSRTASINDKRSAVLTLAGLLEERRELIAKKIGSKDEGDLFGVANRFPLRHQRRGQQGDYDPAFLDLGTVELTNRLITRETHPASSA